VLVLILVLGLLYFMNFKVSFLILYSINYQLIKCKHENIKYQ